MHGEPNKTRWSLNASYVQLFLHVFVTGMNSREESVTGTLLRFLLASFRMVPTRLRHFVEFSSGGTLLNMSNEQEVQGWLNVKAALTLEDFLTLGQHKWNCQLLHMHVLLEAHMPAPCFNNSNQLCPQSKPAGAGQHTDCVTLEPNTAQAATASHFIDEGLLNYLKKIKWLSNNHLFYKTENKVRQQTC